MLYIPFRLYKEEIQYDFKSTQSNSIRVYRNPKITILYFIHVLGRRVLIVEMVMNKNYIIIYFRKQQKKNLRK